jgi:hypothetical protein
VAFNYASAGSCTARYHSRRRGTVELYLATQPTARRALVPRSTAASPHRAPPLPTTKAPLSCLTTRPAAPHSSPPPPDLTPLAHSIPIAPPAVSSN